MHVQGVWDHASGAPLWRYCWCAHLLAYAQHVNEASLRHCKPTCKSFAVGC
jgi:hypothetical protein